MKSKIGQYFHFLQNGMIKNQGLVLTPDRAQLFEWVLGEPTDVIKINAAFFANCNFYATAEEMDLAFQKEHHHAENH